MKKELNNYSSEEFSQDIDFINWVNKHQNHRFWEDFQKEYPEKRKEIETAKKIVTAFRMQQTPSMESDVQETFRKIETIYKNKHLKKSSFSYKNITRYVAVFMVLISIGGTILFLNRTEPDFQFTDINISPQDFIDGKLILPDGNTVLLKEKQTNLQIDPANRQISINGEKNIDTPVDKNNALTQIIIPYGKRSTITLSDGTKVWLNSGSIMKFPDVFTGSKRRIFIEGEAFLEVAHDNKRPFIVNTTKLDVKVLGTQFNISAYPEDELVAVVLVEGSIQAKTKSNQVIMKPNQLLEFDNNTGVKITDQADLSEFLSWKEGWMTCKNTPLGSISTRLCRFYNIQIVFTEEAAKYLTITGKLDLKTDYTELFNVLSSTISITYTIQGNKVFISKKAL